MLRLRTLRSTVLAATLGLAAASLVASSFVPSAHADAAAGTATQFLEAKTKTVRTLLGAPASADRDKKVDAELSTLVDYDEMAKTALGPDEYAKRSKEQLTEFTGILRQLIERNYKKRLNDTLNYELTYKSEQTEKNGDALVTMEAKNLKSKHEAPVLIEYVVRKKGSSFIVVDLKPEGSSMAKTYNKEFTKVIKKDGWDTLIKKMKDKLAKT